MSTKTRHFIVTPWELHELVRQTKHGELQGWFDQAWTGERIMAVLLELKLIEQPVYCSGTFNSADTGKLTHARWTLPYGKRMTAEWLDKILDQYDHTKVKPIKPSNIEPDYADYFSVAVAVAIGLWYWLW